MMPYVDLWYSHLALEDRKERIEALKGPKGKAKTRLLFLDMGEKERRAGNKYKNRNLRDRQPRVLISPRNGTNPGLMADSIDGAIPRTR